jgi:hypothetical protein
MKSKITSQIIALLLGSVYTLSAQCTFSGLNPNYCVNSPTSALTTTTTGGTFVGPGVIGSVFSPSLAGPGTHTITYAVCSSSYAISTGSFTPLTTSGTGVSLSDDAVSSSLPIGFNFKFFCNTYTDFYICSNGFITFSSGQPATYPGQTMPNSSTPNNIIAAVWCDLNPASGGTITYTTLGTQPNRTLVVSYNNVPYYGSTTPIAFQIQLRESSNIIEIHSSSVPTNTYSSTNDRTMGVEDATGSNAYVVTGRNATTTWTVSNECMRFTPGVSCSATQTTIVSPSTISVVGNNSVCVGTTSSLTATGNNTYTWTASSGTISNSNSITVTPSVNTTYSVAGTNTFGCIASSAITVTVDLSPTVTAISSSTGSGVCPGKTLTLNGAGATSYAWTGGITNGVPFSINSSTNFVVTGSNACGSNTAAVSVSIHPTPTVSTVASSASLCSGQSATMVASGTPSFTWFPFGGNNPQLVVSPVVNSTYTVVGTSALGCTNQAVTNISVVTTPVLAPVLSSSLICTGKSATITASGATNYSWSTGPTTSSIVVSPTVTTTYTVTKSNANCVDVKTITLIVNALPTVFAIGGPTLICSMQSTTLNAGGGSTYSWSPFGGNSSQAVVSPSVTTDFVVSASDGTCINTATVPITVNPLPTITIVSTASAICLNQSASMTVVGTDTYSWTNPGTLGTATSVVVSPTTTILYNVVGTNTVTGCSSDAQQIMLVHPLPSMTVAATKTLVCVAGPSTLTVKGNTNTLTYNWSTGPTTTNTIVNPTVTTVYSVTGTNTVTTCQSTSMVAVNVFQPTFATNSPTSTCLGGTISLIASGASSYTWQTNPPQPFSSILVSPQTATYYVVAATSTTVNNLKCDSQDTVFVSIYLNPTITAVPSRTAICKNETVDLIGGGGVTYTWSTFQVGDTVNVKPLSQTNYTVTGTDQNGCKSTATVQVKVSTCVGIGENDAVNLISVYPNPNKGEFTIESASNIDLILVNELGQLIREIPITGENKRKVLISGIANGIYFLKGTNGSENVNQKIIITD